MLADGDPIKDRASEVGHNIGVTYMLILPLVFYMLIC